MARDRLIDFESQETHFLFNPRLPERERHWLEAAFISAGQAPASLPDLPGHIWLASSGTTSATPSLKVFALSKRAFLIAAAAANTHLKSDHKDVWLNVLPNFHVGGLAVHARAFLSGAKVVTNTGTNAVGKWDPTDFVTQCEEDKVTLTSLVPTQVYDLVHGNASAKGKGYLAPRSLRAVLVGGGALSSELYFAARRLGWPLLPTYGMTELCSQVATASLESLKVKDQFPKAELLGHIEARINAEGYLQIRSEALFTTAGYINESGFTPMQQVTDGWYTTNDFCQINHDTQSNARTLSFVGRTGDLIKVSGELVNLAKLRDAFANVYPSLPVVFIAEKCDRLGERVVAVTEVASVASATEALSAFNQTVAPFERVRAIYALQSLPRSAIGKVMLAACAAAIETH